MTAAAEPGGVDIRYQILDEAATAGDVDGVEVLSGAERARAARFMFERDRVQFLAAHVLLRRTLSEHAVGPPDAWTFVENAFGKPSLDPSHGQAGLVFNIAHTHGLVACAVARTAALGIDVERLRSDIGMIDIARRFFAREEVAALESCAPGDRAARFTDIWALKEAYVKAVGEGLSHPLDSFSYAVDGPGLTFAPPPGDRMPWRVALFEPTPAHRMALAAGGPHAGPLTARDARHGRTLAPVYTCAVQPSG